MTSLALGFVSQSNAGTRVDYGRLLDDQTISLQTGDVTARVGKSNFVDFIRIQPNLALSAFHYGSGKALLKTKIDYSNNERQQKGET